MGYCRTDVERRMKEFHRRLPYKFHRHLPSCIDNCYQAPTNRLKRSAQEAAIFIFAPASSHKHFLKQVHVLCNMKFIF